jgi:competence protein ComEA
MFGWQSRLDRDAVAAAQRRLAAIAASFDPSHADRDDLFERLDDEPSGAGLDGVEVDGRAAPLPDGSTAAHSTGGRSRLADDAVGRRAGSPALPRHRIRSRGQLGLAVSPHQVALVALAVVVMVALAAWWVLRSVPHAQPVQLSTQRTLPSSAPAATTPPSPGATTSAPTPAGASPGPGPAPGPAAATGSVVVDVAGRVRRPGIVQLPAGARVVDALRAAGGARPGVQTLSLNLARPLVDGEQIVVGLRVPAMPGSPGSGVTPATGSSIAPVNLNTATAEQLDTLPGIGPVTAQAILTWRTENGSFTSVDELLEVSGIGDATLADIAPYVYV